MAPIRRAEVKQAALTAIENENIAVPAVDQNNNLKRESNNKQRKRIKKQSNKENYNIPVESMEVVHNVNEEENNEFKSSKYFQNQQSSYFSEMATTAKKTATIKRKSFEDDDLSPPIKTECKVEDDEYDDEDERRFSSLKNDEAENPKKSKWEPANWREVFDLIRQMRSEQSAPVDTMGCDALARLPPNLTPQTQRFHVLVSLMLSAQTKDEVTAAATNKLQSLPLDVDTILGTDEEVIAKLIYPVSFYKRKAQYIKRTARILKDVYDGDIPNNVKDLCKLPGVGPKMAYICMSVAWNNCAGIGVDTHVHRISNRLGWTRSHTKLPEQTRKELEDWLPQSHWNEVNHLLVGFGQQVCRPVGPKCSTCLAKDLCPTGKSHPKDNKKTTTTVKKEASRRQLIKIETEPEVGIDDDESM